PADSIYRPRSMDERGTLRLGDGTYPVKSADLTLTFRPDHWIDFSVEIECGRGQHPPSLSIDGSLPGRSPDDLVGEEYVLPRGDGPVPGTRFVTTVAGLYVHEHHTIDRNRVAFETRDAGRVLVRWRGVTDDPIYYDHRARPHAVDVRAWCQIGERRFRR